MDNVYLDILRSEFGNKLPDLDAVSGELSHNLLGDKQLVLTEKACATLFSMMDSLIAQVNMILDAHTLPQLDASPKNVMLLAKERALLLFLTCRYYEWRCMDGGARNSAPAVAELLSSILKTKGQHEELAAKLVSANARFCYNIEQFDITLDELPAELLHILHKFAADALELSHDAFAISMLASDEAENRLTLAAKCVDYFPLHNFTYSDWRHYGAVLFMLEIADTLDIAYDNLILSTALASPWSIMLTLRAAHISPEDIVLIMAEMPLGKQWLAAHAFADQLKLIAQGYTPLRARDEIVAWDEKQRLNNIPYCGYWPLSGAVK